MSDVCYCDNHRTCRYCLLPNEPWQKLEPQRCDLCTKVAKWRHPAGGFRCNTCPRPKETW